MISYQALDINADGYISKQEMMVASTVSILFLLIAPVSHVNLFDPPIDNIVFGLGGIWYACQTQYWNNNALGMEQKKSQSKFNFEKGCTISTFAFVDCYDLQNYFELLG